MQQINTNYTAVDIHEYVSPQNELLRKAIYIASGGKCFYTGRDVSIDDMHIDHITPKGSGGKDCIANYALACQDINHKKAYRHSDKFESVVREVVLNFYAGNVASTLADLRMNTDSLVEINRWMKQHKIDPRSRLGIVFRGRCERCAVTRIKRILPNKTRGKVFYDPKELRAIYNETQSGVRHLRASAPRRTFRRSVNQLESNCASVHD